MDRSLFQIREIRAGTHGDGLTLRSGLDHRDIQKGGQLSPLFCPLEGEGPFPFHTQTGHGRQLLLPDALATGRHLQ